jgi:UbiD family decarboxylase
MPIEDIQELIEVLEKAGELKRISTEVDSELELAEILRRTMYDEGPALLFENVKGYDMPVLGNAFGSMKRLELSLETSDFTEIGISYPLTFSKSNAGPSSYIVLRKISANSSSESTSVEILFNSPAFSKTSINS